MYELTKRMMDIILSLIATILLSPLLLVISILIKLDSKGPILFKQKRNGKNNKFFYIYKFRSMRTDTPNVSTELLGDPTLFITKLGLFIRKTSIDELPQLFNILKGDMSIVGPRPALYNQLDLIKMRSELNVDLVQPGLTGFAQVKGRDMISDTEKVGFDKYYVNNMCLNLDIKIIVWTFIRVLKSDGIRVK